MSASLLPDRVTPAATVSYPVRHLWTVAEFQRMGETGFLHPESRLELIEGELFAMAPIGHFHAGIIRILMDRLGAAVGSAAIVDSQNPIVLDEQSEPQPDIVLLRPRPDYYLHGHPCAQDVLLLIEVSDSTVQFDRKTKVPLYARHGIPEVWLVVGPKRRHIEVHRDLLPDHSAYQTRWQLREGVLAPVQLPQAEIRLDKVFI
ncbi:MAG: Uma2 family endonuclease [Candidatus Competibacteraceae bacterium]|nr:Uma2 family endonuclease [Candidatus Competibacteraceae bacterium]MCP5126173.1 Uma2 family endonuclease [Gammaproteobacteria bacterium]HRX71197.1 Uma2 family endonuclease [Candidatus Competibacteraceae bacterium]